MAAVAVVVVLVGLSLTVGPTRGFIATYQTTGSETLAGIANGFLRAVSWPFVLAGYQPDSQDDTAFVTCLRRAHLDPASVATPIVMEDTAALDCSKGYEQSHIDMSGATQKKFSFHMIENPARPGDAIISIMNKSTDKLLLGADVLFHGNGHVELHHIAAIAFPGHPAQAETQVDLLAGGTAPSGFGFSAIPNVARIANPAVYAPPR